MQEGLHVKRMKCFMRWQGITGLKVNWHEKSDKFLDNWSRFLPVDTEIYQNPHPYGGGGGSDYKWNVPIPIFTFHFIVSCVFTLCINQVLHIKYLLLKSFQNLITQNNCTIFSLRTVLASCLVNYHISLPTNCIAYPICEMPTLSMSTVSWKSPRFYHFKPVMYKA